MFGGIGVPLDIEKGYGFLEKVPDTISTGGKKKIIIGDEQISVSKILSQLYNYAPNVNERINEIDENLLRFYWKVSVINESRINQWKELINQNSSSTNEQVTPSIIFQAGYDNALTKQ